jgi:ketosteroid isomerase-like protein
MSFHMPSSPLSFRTLHVGLPGCLLGVLLAALAACSPKPPAHSPEAQALRSYFAAFNRHDPAAAAALLAPNVKWMTVDTDKLTVEGQGREAVRDWLTGYFQAQPDVRSEFLSLEQTGILLAVRGRVSWTTAGTPRVEESHAVYEIRNGLITNVWFFPAVRQTPDSRK